MVRLWREAVGSCTFLGWVAVDAAESMSGPRVWRVERAFVYYCTPKRSGREMYAGRRRKQVERLNWRAEKPARQYASNTPLDNSRYNVYYPARTMEVEHD